MSFSHVLAQSWSSSGREITSSKAYTGDSQISIDVSVPDSSTDMFVELSLDISEIQTIYILSDQAITLETNDGTTPGDTIVLVANKPLTWEVDSGHDNLFTVDVAALYVTQSSGSAARLQIEALTDPTP